MTTTKKKRGGLRVRSNIQVRNEYADVQALRQIAEKNPQRFLEVSCDLIEQGKLRWEDCRDIRGLFSALIDTQVEVRAEVTGIGIRRLTTSAFPILAGALTAEFLEREDDEADTVWQELVEVRETNKETTHLVRIVNQDPSHIGGRPRKEGDPYPLMTAGEDRVQVDTVDDGRRVAIGAKLLEQNDQPGFLEQLGALREWASNRRDTVTLERVYDLYGSAATPAQPYVYRPNGTGTPLYTTSTSALSRAPSGTRLKNNPFVDGQSLQRAIDVLAAMLNDNGQKAGNVSMLELLAPHALSYVIDEVLFSERTPGVANQFNPFGPRGRYQIRPIYSPKIDDFTTSSWILCRGGFRKQFKLVSRLNMEFVSMPASMQDYLRTRLAYEARIADEFEVAAKDHNRAVQSLEGDAAPTPPNLGA